MLRKLRSEGTMGPGNRMLLKRLARERRNSFILPVLFADVSSPVCAELKGFIALLSTQRIASQPQALKQDGRPTLRLTAASVRSQLKRSAGRRTYPTYKSRMSIYQAVKSAPSQAQDTTFTNIYKPVAAGDETALLSALEELADDTDFKLPVVVCELVMRFYKAHDPHFVELVFSAMMDTVNRQKGRSTSVLDVLQALRTHPAKNVMLEAFADGTPKVLATPMESTNRPTTACQSRGISVVEDWIAGATAALHPSKMDSKLAEAARHRLLTQLTFLHLLKRASSGTEFALQPSSEGFAQMLEVYAKTKQFKKLLTVVELMKELDVRKHGYIQELLMTQYIEQGCTTEAKALLHEVLTDEAMPKRFIYRIAGRLMKHLKAKDDFQSCLTVTQDLKHNGIMTLDLVLLAEVAWVHGRLGDAAAIVRLIEAERDHKKLDGFVFSGALSGLLKYYKSAELSAKEQRRKRYSAAESMADVMMRTSGPDALSYFLLARVAAGVQPELQEFALTRFIVHAKEEKRHVQGSEMELLKLCNRFLKSRQWDKLGRLLVLLEGASKRPYLSAAYGRIINDLVGSLAEDNTDKGASDALIRLLSRLLKSGMEIRSTTAYKVLVSGNREARQMLLEKIRASSKRLVPSGPRASSLEGSRRPTQPSLLQRIVKEAAVRNDLGVLLDLLSAPGQQGRVRYDDFSLAVRAFVKDRSLVPMMGLFQVMKKQNVHIPNDAMLSIQRILCK